MSLVSQIVLGFAAVATALNTKASIAYVDAQSENIDGGTPESVYGGTDGFDGGGP